MMVLSCSTLDWRSKKTTQPRKKLNLKLWFDSTYCVPQLRGVRLFTIQGEMFMSIRIQNSDRKIAKNSNATATISRGRCDAILEGNKIISLQKSGYEMRNHYADATLKQLADSIYSMLNRKASKKINSDIYSLEYGINKMGIRDRLKQIEIMKQRKAGLLVA